MSSSPWIEPHQRRVLHSPRTHLTCKPLDSLNGANTMLVTARSAARALAYAAGPGAGGVFGGVPVFRSCCAQSSALGSAAERRVPREARCRTAPTRCWTRGMEIPELGSNCAFPGGDPSPTPYASTVHTSLTRSAVFSFLIVNVFGGMPRDPVGRVRRGSPPASAGSPCSAMAAVADGTAPPRRPAR